MLHKRRPKIGLALSGGSARGFAHIGVINVLEQAGIPIDFIAGTSMGALVGAFYAAGRSAQEMETLASSIDKRKLFQLLDPAFRGGLIAGEKVYGMFEEHLRDTTFEQCRMPLKIVATDLNTGDAVVFSEGVLVPAIRASISLPLVFTPVSYREHLLTDGGLSVALPAKVVREMGADIVIAVNVLSHLNTHITAESKGLGGLIDIANGSLSIMMRSLSLHDARYADIVIEPEVGAFESHRFDLGSRFIELGEAAAKAKVADINASITEHTSLIGRLLGKLGTQ